MLVVAGAIVRITAIRCGLKLFGKCRSPLLPRKVALGGKPYGKSECLGLPGLGKDWTVFIARQRRQRRQPFLLGWLVRHAQGNSPKDRGTPSLATKQQFPTIPGLQNARNTNVGVARPENVRGYPETRRCR